MTVRDPAHVHEAKGPKMIPPATKKKRKSGKPIPDAQRRTTRVTVHLPPDVAAELRRRGVRHPRGASGVVAELLGGQAEEIPKARLVAAE